MRQIKKDMLAHAIADYPREACGLVAGGVYYPCRNMAHPDSKDAFQISGEQWAQIEDIAPIEAVFHSHPDWISAPSEADKASCEQSGVPWFIVSIRDRKADGWSEIKPRGYEAPLVGRAFVHGVHDCLAIVLDYYKRELGIDLGSYDRKDNWWNEGGNLYLENLPAAGFVKVSAPLNGDIILMQIRSPVPNHAGIFLADGVIKCEPEHYAVQNSILHHMHGRESKRDIYGGYWAESTVSIWRYVGKDQNDPALR